ncbi:hypothetical protein A4G19_01170 [Pasteurellaceae bacterium Macca]|nr:hypothetical protein [Pasteurellaceae bacterium Macca]
MFALPAHSVEVENTPNSAPQEVRLVELSRSIASATHKQALFLPVEQTLAEKRPQQAVKFFQDFAFFPETPFFSTPPIRAGPRC